MFVYNFVHTKSLMCRKRGNNISVSARVKFESAKIDIPVLLSNYYN